MEYALYEYVRDVYKTQNASFYRPLTEALIIQLVGKFGLDILTRSKLIGPTDYPGQYVLWCES